VRRWLSRLTKKTAVDYEYSFNRFMNWLKEQDCKFSNFTPDELVEYQKNTDNGTKYELLDLIQDYIQRDQGKEVRLSTKQRNYAILRSFFMHARAELPRDPSFNLRSKEPPVKGILSLEDLRKVCLKSNRAYRAIYLSMFQGGMDRASFEHWNLSGLSDLMQQINRGKEVVKIDLPGRKHNRNKRSFYTFIGPDAVSAIKEYLKTREEKEGSAIFLNQYGEPISSKSVYTYWKRKLIALGLIELERNGFRGARYGRNPHELRDLFRSQWSKSSASHVVAEFLLGHLVDPLGYDKSFRDEDYYRREYVKALSQLQIMSSSTPFGKVDLSEVESLKQQLTEKDHLIQELKSRLNGQEARFQQINSEFEEFHAYKKNLQKIVEKLESREKRDD